jgi:sec-independent protein translocase protein TatB
MFEVGFSELVLIFGLALIVLGPQRLPKLAAQIGRWVGRARAMARQFREQLDQEVNLEESAPRKPAPVTPSAAQASSSQTSHSPPSADQPAAQPNEPSPATQSSHERTGS